MTKNPNKDSFASVTKRSSKSNRSDSGIPPPNTRLRAKVTSAQQKSSIPTQIETNVSKADDSSRISNKSTTSSKLEAHYKKLLRQKELDFAAKIKNYENKIQDLELSLDANNLTASDLQKENSNLTHTNQKLSEEITDLEDELDDHKNLMTTSLPPKVVTENKNKNKKNNTNNFTVPEDPDDDNHTYEHGDLDDEDKSYPSVSRKNYSTPGTGNNPPDPSAAIISTIPVSTPAPHGAPPPGHIYTQFRHTDGSILWQIVPTPVPPSTGKTNSSGTSSSPHTNLNHNPNFHQQGLFTAPPGCLQFHRPTWSKEIKDISCNSDDLNDIKTWYDDLSSCLLSATQGRNVLPKMENLTPTHDFRLALLPPSNQANFTIANNAFNALSSALRLYLTKKKTFDDCPETILVLELHKAENCGLVMLLKLLSEIFPHLGAGYIDFVTEINKLQLSSDDSVYTLLRKTTGLQRRLTHTNQIHPPNSVIHKFLSELRQNKEMAIHLSSIYLAYNTHLKDNGPNIAFPMSPHEVYKHLKLLGVNLKAPLLIDNPTTPDVPSDSAGLFHTPVARAAFVQVEERPLYPERKHTKNVTKAKSRYKRCEICNDYHPSGPNPELRCPARGVTWIPDWKRKAAAKYNAMHPKQTPDPDFIKAPPPVRSGTTKPTAKQVSIPVEDLQDDMNADIFHDAQEEQNFLDYNDDDSSASEDDHSPIAIRPVSKMARASRSEIQSCSADSNGLYQSRLISYYSDDNSSTSGDDQSPFVHRPVSRMAQASLGKDHSNNNDLTHYYLIGTHDKSISKSLHSLIQDGSNRCTPPPKFAKIIWTNVDSGANIHISNDPHTVTHSNKTTSNIDQVDGSHSPVDSIAHCTFWLGNRFVHDTNTFLMPSNPTCTLGSAALKIQNGYINTHHDQFLFATYKHSDGSSFTFSKANGLLRTINALDYVPIIFYLNKIPNCSDPICKQVQLRRTSRRKKPTARMQEYKLSIRNNENDHTNKLPPSTPSCLPCTPDKSDTTKITSTVPVENTSPCNIESEIISIPAPEEKVNDPVPSSHNVQGRLSSLIVHLKFACRNHKSLRHMYSTQALLGMPQVSHPKTPCPICLIVKNTRLSKNKETHMGTFRPGQLMMMDFAFFSCTSIRGYVAYFSVTCQATGYGFVFAVPNKRPPLGLITWLTETLKRQGRPISFVRFDEGGELARSQQVCDLLIKLNIVMQTTGGYSSSLLGKDERQHRTIAEMITSMLYTANLPSSYWCFAIMYAIWLKRRWCNYPDSVTPYEKWFAEKPEFASVHIFGAPITITDETANKENPRNRIGRFLGFGSTSAVIIYEDILSKKIKRARNCRIDDYFSLALTHPQLKCPASQIIQAFSTKSTLPQLSLELPMLEYTSSPFLSHELFTYEVTLPSTGPLGLILQDDEFFGLPVIVSMEEFSPFTTKCKKQLRRQSWIINIHHDEPITVDRFLTYVTYLQHNNILQVKVTFFQKSNYSEN